jgi:hypothetical protein
MRRSVFIALGFSGALLALRPPNGIIGHSSPVGKPAAPAVKNQGA